MPGVAGMTIAGSRKHTIKKTREALTPRAQYFHKLTLLKPHEHPVVDPHVSHLRHVPLRTSVKFWHSGQASPT